MVLKNSEIDGKIGSVTPTPSGLMAYVQAAVQDLRLAAAATPPLVV